MEGPVESSRTEDDGKNRLITRTTAGKEGPRQQTGTENLFFKGKTREKQLCPDRQTFSVRENSGASASGGGKGK